ncbi:MAG: glutamate racemase [Oscillospiraceae bacterium]|jgi:glutamate racemase|nr:glutamate racemase [Oscillospiraceae bacterium]
MDNRPIGVFDSGLGGLTAVRALDALLPYEDIVYFGDTARVPYGTRSREIILKYLRQDVAFLGSFGVKLLVVACGTASTAGLSALDGAYEFPLLGVVEPAVRAAAEASRNRKVGLIATPAAVASGAYEAALKARAPDIQVTAAACPLLVPLVENGRARRGDVVAETVCREYLRPLQDAGVDTLILGCTHYPLLSGVFRDIMGAHVLLIDAGEAVARAAAAHLRESAALSADTARGVRRYFVSDSPPGFAATAALLLGRPLDGPVEKADVESEKR